VLHDLLRGDREPAPHEVGDQVEPALGLGDRGRHVVTWRIRPELGDGEEVLVLGMAQSL
jgi:hypothetical protein